jgi:hypothetical protein
VIPEKFVWKLVLFDSIASNSSYNNVTSKLVCVLSKRGRCVAGSEELKLKQVVLPNCHV